jgi:hypothetical protein
MTNRWIKKVSSRFLNLSHKYISKLLLTVLSELLSLVVEFNDLSGAHEGEIEGICEEDNVLASVVLEADLLEAVDVPRHTLEVRGGVLNASLHFIVEGGKASSLLSGE